MNKVLTDIFEVICAILVMFLCVIIYFSFKDTELERINAEKYVNDLSGQIEATGVLTEEQWNTFLELLDGTNVRYDISLEHRYEVKAPEYRLRTVEEIIRSQNQAYTGSGAVETTDTNQSVIESYVPIDASPDHVHTSECYLGHRHGDNYYTSYIHHHTDECLYTGNTDVLIDIKIVYSSSSNVRTGYPETYTSSLGTTYYAYCHECKELLYECSFGGGASYYGSSFGWNHKVCNQPEAKTSIPPDAELGSYTNWLSEQAIGKSEWVVDEDESGYTFTPIDDKYSYREEYSRTSKHIKAEGIRFTLEKFPYTQYYKGCTTDNCMKQSKTTTYSCGFTEGQEIKELHECHEVVVSDYPMVDIEMECEDGSILYDRGGAPIYHKHVKICCAECGRVLLEYHQYYASLCDFETNVSGTNIEGATIYTVEEVAKNNQVVTGKEWNDYLNSCEGTETEISLADYHGSSNYIGTYATKVCKNIEFTLSGFLYSRPFTGCSCGALTYGSHIEYDCGLEQDEETICNHMVDLMVPTNAKQVVRRGSGIVTTAIVTMKDGSTNIVVCSATGYDPTKIGDQTVKLSYQYTVGNQTYKLQSDIEVSVFGKITCSICGFEYELYPDGSDPGCPNCISKTPIFTENILVYEEKKYTNEILETIEQHGFYKLRKNDSLQIKLESKKKTVSNILLNKLFQNRSLNRIYIERYITIKDEEKVNK